MEENKLIDYKKNKSITHNDLLWCASCGMKGQGQK